MPSFTDSTSNGCALYLQPVRYGPGSTCNPCNTGAGSTWSPCNNSRTTPSAFLYQQLEPTIGRLAAGLLSASVVRCGCMGLAGAEGP
jgi:hypothetical protein